MGTYFTNPLRGRVVKGKSKRKLGNITRLKNNQFRARIMVEGQSISRNFLYEEDAVRWLNDKRDAIKSGRFAAQRLSETVTLREALERYGRDISPTKKRVKDERSAIVRILDALGSVAGRPIGMVHTSDITDYIEKRLKTTRQRAGGPSRGCRTATLSPSSVNREVAIISHCYTVATSKWGINGLQNPVIPGVRPSENEKRTRRLEGDEEQRLIAAAIKHDEDPRATVLMVPVIHFAIESAMRLSEIASLAWRNVNLVEGSALLPMTKNGRARKVALTPYSVRLLSSLPRRPDGLVFYSKSAINTAWKKVRDASGILDLRFHDLRHEAISRLFEETSLSESEIAAISGHLSPVMLRRYTHLRVGPIVAKLMEAEAKRDELRAKRGSPVWNRSVA